MDRIQISRIAVCGFGIRLCVNLCNLWSKIPVRILTADCAENADCRPGQSATQLIEFSTLGICENQRPLRLRIPIRIFTEGNEGNEGPVSAHVTRFVLLVTFCSNFTSAKWLVSEVIPSAPSAVSCKIHSRSRLGLGLQRESPARL